MKLVALCAFLCVCVLSKEVAGHTSKTVWAVAPNLVRMNTEENVMVTLYNIKKRVSVTVFLEDWPNKKKKFSEKRVHINNGETKTVPVQVTPADIPAPEDTDVAEKQWVYVTVTSTDKEFVFTRTAVVMVHDAASQVFIQTDKPIYMPGQEVKIRIIPVGSDMKPTTEKLRMDVKDPQGIIVHRVGLQWEGKFIVRYYSFPQQSRLGNWSISITHGREFRAETSVQIELRNYVLPTYDVIITSPRYILPDHQRVDGKVEARYVYGKPVKGSVFFTFWVTYDDKKQKIGTKRKELAKGFATFTFPIDTIREHKQLWFPENGRLVVEAEVTEKATGHRELEEDRSCRFVLTPYSFQMKDSPLYFKPELPYDLKIQGVFSDGRPAANLPVIIKAQGIQNGKQIALQNQDARGLHYRLDDDGHATFRIDVVQNIESIKVTIKSNDDELRDEQQAEYSFNLLPYQSPTKSYITVRPQAENFKVGSHIRAEVMTNRNRDINSISFLVLSRGKIIREHTIAVQPGLTITDQFEITSDMVPAIRIVAYFIREKGGKMETVSDSAWVDIEDSCASEVTLRTDKDEYLPDSNGMLRVTGQPDTLVGFLAVDRAVYLLNDNDVLTRSKLFSHMEKMDGGCGAGAGANNADVFTKAGLTVMTNAGVNMAKRDSLTCDEKNRQKRSTTGPYGFSRHTRDCCRRGVHLDVELDCKQAADELVNTTAPCRRVFYRCCEKAHPKLGRDRAGGPEILFSFEDIEEDESRVKIRSNFPESWLFEDGVILPSGKLRKSLTLPSSITEWSFQALTISATSGFCIAKPTNVTVFKSFFIQMGLPPVAIRMEQISITVTVFNYRDVKLPVSVYMYGVEGICSDARPGKKSRRKRFYVNKNDAVSVSFPIMPMAIGNYPIKVIAFSPHNRDGVEKHLKVIAEGKKKRIPYSTILDPGKALEKRGENNDVKEDRRVDGIKNEHVGDHKQLNTVELKLPMEAIPGTESCSVFATGSVLGPSVHTVIEGTEAFFTLPRGCAEQTIIRLAPIVSAYKYMAHNNLITKDVEKNGLHNMREGIQWELQYRKVDGSFAVWKSHPSSTWLTAFILKVFCQAKEFVFVDDNVVCTATEWLLRHQAESGAFTEPYKVHHRDMVGGVNNEVSLTAFILISLLECDCKTEDVQSSLEKAVVFLEEKIDEIDRSYELAMATYALAMWDSPKKLEANNKLLAASVVNEEKRHQYWPLGREATLGGHKPYWYTRKPLALEVETTSYAMLAQLSLGRVEHTHNILRWLTEQRSAKGAFVSSQDTVVGLQAITEYSIKTFAEELDLHCQLTTDNNNAFLKKLLLSQQDALVQKQVHSVPTGGNLFIDTTGTGVGQLQVEVSYNVHVDKTEICEVELNVVSREIPFSSANAENKCDPCDLECKEYDYDYEEVEEDDGDENGDDGDEDDKGDGEDEQEEYDYEYDYYEYIDDGDMDLIVSRIKSEPPKASKPPVDILDGRGRVKRNGGSQNDRVKRSGGSKKVICLKICFRSLKLDVTDMAILDIGLFTGFTPIKEDLEKLVAGAQIQRYEQTDRSVIMYLEEIPQEELCINLRARQDFTVGQIKAVPINIYEYYEPSKSCTTFYKPSEGSPLLQKICTSRRMCKCLEGQCPKVYTEREKDHLTIGDLVNIACGKTDYVFKVTVNEKTSDSIDNIDFTVIDVTILKVIKRGREDVQEEMVKQFKVMKTCEGMSINAGREYLVMGKDSPAYKDADGVQVYQYMMGDETFFMEFYDKHDDGLGEVNRRVGQLFDRFTSKMDREGCAV